MTNLLGLFCGFLVIIGGALADGDPLSSLASLTAVIIVIGGTLAALLTQFGLGHLLFGLKGIIWLVKPPRVDLLDERAQIAEWSSVARSQGTLALEGVIPTVTDHFQAQGLQMIVDNTPPDEMPHRLAALAEETERHQAIPGEVWEAGGGYTPTIGVMGAVLGLIHVMMRLDHPEELGEGIATAFVATIYGVGAANLVFLPLGTRLKMLAKELTREREVLIQGFVLLAEGKPGIVIKQNLLSLLPDVSQDKPAAAADEAEDGETDAEPAGQAA
jgi:chemotaxis protein MotA